MFNVTPLQLQFSRALCNVVADWSKTKSCQPSLLCRISWATVKFQK